MANYAFTTLGITETTSVDAVNDSKFGQVQATLFTVNASNLLVSIVNATASDLGIDQSTKAWFLNRKETTCWSTLPKRCL